MVATLNPEYRAQVVVVAVAITIIRLMALVEVVEVDRDMVALEDIVQ